MRSDFIEMSGQVFGTLTVLSYAGNDGHGKNNRWFCRCVCGHISQVQGGSLRGGHTTGCPQCRIKGRTTHKMSYTREYKCWQCVIQRCHNPKDNNYHGYGAIGITVCERWRESFENFIDDMGLPPTNKHTLDRIKNDKGYAPGNCRWVTMKEQAQNRRSNVFVEFKGESKTIAQWCSMLKLPYSSTCRRIRKYNWPVETAFTKPMKKTNRKKLTKL